MASSYAQDLHIEPVPTPRLRFRRAGQKVLTYYPKGYSAYLTEIGESYNGPDFGPEPLYVEATFYLPRPKSHFGTGRNADTLKESAPAKPTTRSDVDNYLKGLLDGLSGHAYKDDRQVVQVMAEKCWGEPRIHLFIQLHE